MIRDFFILLFCVLIFFAVRESTFILPEHSQALILQFGKIQGAPVTEAGLHWKMPYTHEVRLFEKRLLQWDGEPTEVPTRDRKFIWVDTTARWRIQDALMFYKALKDIPNALSRMGTIINGVTKDTISTMNLIETVRNSNDILEDIKRSGVESAKTSSQGQDERELELAEAALSVESISIGREKISDMITERAQKELANFGIELVDVQLRSIAYKEVVEQKVYKRMISERGKIASQIRAFGAGEKAKILGQLELALKKIQSEAYRKSQEIKGQADAESSNILSAVLKEDTDYYEFVRSLEAYKKTLRGKAELVLSTDNAFLKIFNKGP